MVDLNAFNSAKDFFSEWEDSREYFGLFFIIIIFAIFSLSWIQVSIPTVADQASIFLVFGIIGLIFAVGDYNNEKNGLTGFAFIGKNVKTLAIGLVAGIALAVFFFSSKFAIIGTPLSAVQISATTAAFVFVVLVAPLLEEFVFRMGLYPTLINLFEKKLGYFKAGIISLVIVCSFFAMFHFVAFNASIGLMFSAFLFSAIAIVGNRLFGTAGFSYGLHLANNFLVFGGFAFLLGGM